MSWQCSVCTLCNESGTTRCMVCASAKGSDACAMETDEDLAALAAPKLTRQLSGSGRSLLASISSDGAADSSAVAEEEIPAAVPLRRSLTNNSGAVFDKFMTKDKASTASLENAAGVLRRAADAERVGHISYQAKLHVQEELLCRGVSEAVQALEAALAAGNSTAAAASTPAGSVGLSASTSAAAALTPVEEKPKKKKKKQGYADMMAAITAPKSTNDEKQEQLERRLREGLGGGQFSKLDRI